MSYGADKWASPAGRARRAGKTKRRTTRTAKTRSGSARASVRRASSGRKSRSGTRKSATPRGRGKSLSCKQAGILSDRYVALRNQGLSVEEATAKSGYDTTAVNKHFKCELY